MSAPATTLREPSTPPTRCIACAAPLAWGEACAGCGRESPVVDGILHAIGPLQGTNRIAANFYDGPTWPRFVPWERLFLWFQGPGQARARRQILRHLPEVGAARVLEVGIGDEFLAMVFEHRTDIDALARRVWPGHRRWAIWNRLGYCLVDPGTRRPPELTERV